MADEKPNPSIPAWQRLPTASTNDQGEEKVSTPDDPVYAQAHPPSTDISQLEQVHSFLQDPSVIEASLEKKREFLDKQGIPKDIIDQALHSADTDNQTSTDTVAPSAPPADTMAAEFASSDQFRPAPPTASPANPPPIITYPEFLIEAHKPPPLITPSRLISATYFAAASAALLYGASQYLVTPMVASLTQVRHEFSTHTQSKVDEFNDRLSKIVTKVPEPRRDGSLDVDLSEVESISSDPTELYHRDMGTQTSPPPPSTSSHSIGPPPDPKRDIVAYHAKGLTIMRDHLSEITEGLEKVAETEKDTKLAVNAVRHELDTMLYASPGVMMWGQGEDTLTKSPPHKDDAVEELKREIRGVKGVLLSARRFPSARVGT